MKDRLVAKSMEEVWEWKDSCYREVESLPLHSALQKRLKDSIEKTRELGLMYADLQAQPSMKIAEKGATYETKRKPDSGC
ncbi:MAG: hypothetical protein K9M45_01935 [Kiritimatiellales bacterium]|nr:hypothetical protein [Kiritimatiellales bacterium]